MFIDVLFHVRELPLCPTSTTCNYGDINLSADKIVTLYPGTYNINSLSITGNAQLVVAPYPPGTPNAGQYGPVVINVTGNNNATAIGLEGNGVSNPTYLHMEVANTSLCNGLCGLPSQRAATNPLRGAIH